MLALRSAPTTAPSASPTTWLLIDTDLLDCSLPTGITHSPSLSVCSARHEKTSASASVTPTPRPPRSRWRRCALSVSTLCTRSARTSGPKTLPSEPGLSPPSRSSTSDIAGMRAATTMPPSSPIFLSFRSSTVMESARISLIGIPLNISILRLPRTAAESCAVPSPVILFQRTSTRIKEPVEMSDTKRMMSAGLRRWLAKLASFWSRLMPNSMMPFSVPILASIVADPTSSLFLSASTLAPRSRSSRAIASRPHSQATSSAVLPCGPTEFTSCLAWSRIAKTTSCLSSLIAYSRALTPRSSRLVTSALRSRSMVTTAACPPCAAAMSAVMPRPLAWSISSGDSSRSARSSSISPCCAARTCGEPPITHPSTDGSLFGKGHSRISLSARCRSHRRKASFRKASFRSGGLPSNERCNTPSTWRHRSRRCHWFTSDLDGK